MIGGALANAVNPDISSISNVDPAAPATTAWLGRFAVLFCLWTIVECAGRPGSTGRLERVLKAPVVWVIFYQLIVAYHMISDGAYWNVAGRCGDWLILVAGMAISPPMAADSYILRIRSVFRGLIWLSIITAVLNPTVALVNITTSNSFIPGIDVRLSGIAGNPNQLGAIAAVAVLLELHHLRIHRQRVNWTFVYLVMSIIVLLLTQSKTSLIACSLGGSYLIGATLGRRSSTLEKVIVGIGVGVALSGLGWFMVSNWVTANAKDISTATGRTDFWRLLWDMGWERPWFGYGTGWGSDLRGSRTFQYQIAVGYAHNQLLDTFLTTGLAGIVCWFLYVVALIRGARGVCGSVRSLYIAILMVMLVRCFTESGLEPGGYFLTQQIQTILIGCGFCKACASGSGIALSRGRWAGAETRVALRLRALSVGRSAI
jgi:O-antigen ligase